MSPNLKLTDSLRMESPLNGGTNRLIRILSWPLPIKWIQDHRYSTVMVGEIIGFCCCGTVLLSRITSMTACPFECGIRR